MRYCINKPSTRCMRGLPVKETPLYRRLDLIKIWRTAVIALSQDWWPQTTCQVKRMRRIWRCVTRSRSRRGWSLIILFKSMSLNQCTIAIFLCLFTSDLWPFGLSINGTAPGREDVRFESSRLLQQTALKKLGIQKNEMNSNALQFFMSLTLMCCATAGKSKTKHILYFRKTRWGRNIDQTMSMLFVCLIVTKILRRLRVVQRQHNILHYKQIRRLYLDEFAFFAQIIRPLTILTSIAMFWFMPSYFNV